MKMSELEKVDEQPVVGVKKVLVGWEGITDEANEAIS